MEDIYVRWTSKNYVYYVKEFLSVKFVVGSFICSERFFSGYSGFPLSSKTSIFKFQFDQVSGKRRTTMWMCYLQMIVIEALVKTKEHVLTV